MSLEALTYCPECGSTAAALGDYDRIGESSFFYLHIMCGDCHHWRYVEAHEIVCDTWEDLYLDAAAEHIERIARVADRNIFLDQAAIFVAALNRDLIDAGDFA